MILLCLGGTLSAQEISTIQVATGIANPTDIQNAGDGSGRLFLVQQNGIIKILRNGALVSTPFLDIRSKTIADGERGLLGLAFPKGFAQSGRFYVDYTDRNGDTNISLFRMSSDPDVGDANSETILLHIPQPFSNHNGGQLRFGPDGFLYVGMGDGGSGGDPLGNGQNRGSLLGKLLRLDVESSPGKAQIPASNPFQNSLTQRPEVWAYGLRNPWRFSFDRVTGDLWIADVGQGLYEEVDLQPASSKGGENYGWNIMEGLHCYGSATCAMQGLTLPIAEYSHADGSCSITGGFLYRGNGSPGLRGTYVYGDYCTGRISGIDRQGSSWVARTLLSPGYNITTFGEDEAGELYVANAATGIIYRIQGSSAPRLSAANIVDAASFQPGIVAGSLATAFASGLLDTPGVVSAPGLPLPLTLSNITVTVNGATAPVLAVANRAGVEQVNFQVPFQVAGATTVVTVARGNNTSSAATVTVPFVQPAIYTTNGTAAVVVHNADFSLVTAARPLQTGEYAFLYASGLGPVSNQPATGAAGPSSPLASVQNAVTLTLGGQPCEVQFAGLAPGFAGVYQVNFRVPDTGGSTSGKALVLQSRDATSPAAATP